MVAWVFKNGGFVPEVGDSTPMTWPESDSSRKFEDLRLAWHKHIKDLTWLWLGINELRLGLDLRQASDWKHRLEMTWILTCICSFQHLRHYPATMYASHNVSGPDLRNSSVEKDVMCTTQTLKDYVVNDGRIKEQWCAKSAAQKSLTWPPQHQTSSINIQPIKKGTLCYVIVAF